MSTNVSQPTQIWADTRFSTKHAVSRSDMLSFTQEIFTNTFLSNITLLYESPIDNIISVRHYPFDASRVSWGLTSQQTPPIENIYVNTYQVPNISGATINPTVPPLINVGGIWIGRYFNSFLDYAPYTEIELFLPFCGFVKLDTDLVMNKYVSVKYGVDFNTGMCTAFIEVSTDSTQADAVLITTKEFKIGVDLPVCGGGFNEMAKALTQTGLKTAVGTVGAVAGGVIGGVGGAVIGSQAVSGVLNSTIDTAFTQKLQTTKGEITSGYNSFYSPSNMYLIISRPDVQYPTNYNHSYGRPLMTTDTIQNMVGYTEVEKVHIEGSGFESALTEEKRQIEELLKAGVIV